MPVYTNGDHQRREVWLIIDDLGMRKLGPTAAEELLEIVMRRSSSAVHT